MATLAVTFTALGGMTAAPSHAADCVDVRVVAVRGSGEQGGLAGHTAQAVYDTAKAAFPAGLSSTLTGVDYPAVGLDPAAGIGGLLAFGSQYDSSRAAGVAALSSYLRRQAACVNERWILVGYSQGAHVVGDALSARGGVPAVLLKDRVAGVLLFGDPRFNPGEKYDEGSYAADRSGLLGPRPRGALRALSGRVTSWCDAGDPVCQGIGGGVNAQMHDGRRYVLAHGSEIVGAVRGDLAVIPRS